MLSSQMNWKLKESLHETLQYEKINMEVSPIVQQLLSQRGVSTAPQTQAFLYPDMANLHDPSNLSSMKKAGDRVHQAIENDESVLVFGDYDADGVSSTTVMMNTLTELGANCAFYIPNRFTEGYGPNEAAFHQASEKGFKLIITVDTGIAAVHEAAIAKELGIDLIITDHHEAQEQMPDAFAIVHPKYSPDYPFKELAGVGVAFKFAQYLLGYFPEQLLDLVAIGTIADLVPLTDENRVLAFHGLKKLTGTKREGLIALKNVCQLEGPVTEEHVGFQIGPHLNAVGRLQDADLAVELLMTEDNEEAKELALTIQELNKERKKIVAKIADEAKEMLEQMPNKDGVIVVANSGWNEGVLGIVASKLVREYDRPAIVLSINGESGTAKGSARSIPAFDLFQGCMEVRNLFTNFGGHSQAAGMTLALENVAELRSSLNEIIYSQLSADDFKQEMVIDAELKPDDVSLKLIMDMDKLAPFGMKNNKPVFLLSGMPDNIRKIGNEGKHLKMQWKQDKQVIEGIGFGLGEKADFMTPNTCVSVAGELNINEWNGNRKPQIVIRDLQIDDRQVFDHRGKRNIDISKYLRSGHRAAIVKNADAEGNDWSSLDVQQSTYYRAEEELSNVQDLFLFDLPDDLSLLQGILKSVQPENIHVCFYVQNSAYLSVFPGRNEFKKLYAYIFKHKQINAKMDMEMLASLTGLNKQNVNFMLRVFLELDFLKLENGTIALLDSPHKRDLSTSALYKQRKQQMEVEKVLYYATYDELCKWFKPFITVPTGFISPAPVVQG